MAAPIFYSHTDSGAPVLTGQVSKMIDLLTACLVTGYGSKAAAGWTKPYTGTNLAAFKPAAGSSGQLIRVDDTQARESRIRLYRTMSAISTGTGHSPSTTGYVRWWKSADSGSTPRAWWLLADPRGFILIIHSAQAIGASPEGHRHPTIYGCGDLLPFNSGDPTPFFIAGQPTDDSTDSTYYSGRCVFPYATHFTHSVPSAGDRHFWMSANAAGTNSPQTGHPQSFGSEWGTPMPSGGEAQFPAGEGAFIAGYFASEVYLQSGTQRLRGIIPGILFTPHSVPFTDWTPVTIPGFGSCLPVPFSDGAQVDRGQALLRLGDWRA